MFVTFVLSEFKRKGSLDRLKFEPCQRPSIVFVSENLYLYCLVLDWLVPETWPNLLYVYCMTLRQYIYIVVTAGDCVDWGAFSRQRPMTPMMGFEPATFGTTETFGKTKSHIVLSLSNWITFTVTSLLPVQVNPGGCSCQENALEYSDKAIAVM